MLARGDDPSQCEIEQLEVDIEDDSPSGSHPSIDETCAFVGNWAARGSDTRIQLVEGIEYDERDRDLALYDGIGRGFKPTEANLSPIGVKEDERARAMNEYQNEDTSVCNPLENITTENEDFSTHS